MVNNIKVSLKKILGLKELSIISVFLVLQLTVIFLVPRYTSVSNFQLILRATPSLGVLALGVCILMIAGEFDLSVGSTFALGPIVGILLYNLGLNIWLVFFLAILLGSFIGFINGLVTVATKIPSFIATLSTMMILRGLVLIITDGAPAVFKPNENFSNIFNSQLSIFPIQFIWFIGFSVIFWLLLNKHFFGNWIAATGGNLKAAQALGINTSLVKIICFCLTGALATFAGFLDAVRVVSISPLTGDGLALTVIAAVVIGGTSLYGGDGTILGTFLGTIIIFTISDILLLMKVKAYYFRFFVGIIIIIAVILNITIRRKQYEI